MSKDFIEDAVMDLLVSDLGGLIGDDFELSDLIDL